MSMSSDLIAVKSITEAIKMELRTIQYLIMAQFVLEVAILLVLILKK